MSFWKPSGVPNAGFAIVIYDMLSSSVRRPQMAVGEDATSGRYRWTSAESLIGLAIPLCSHPRGDLRSAREVELGEDVLHVVLRCAFRNEQALRDLAVGQPFGDQPSDLVLERFGTL